MWGKAAVGETSKRFLSRDDLAGLCAVYGAEATPTCATADYVPDHGFTAQCSVVAGTTTHRSCSIAAPGARTTPTPWAAITLIGLVACSRRRRPA